MVITTLNSTTNLVFWSKYNSACSAHTASYNKRSPALVAVLSSGRATNSSTFVTSFNLLLTHNDSNYELLRDNEEPIVWHEPILDMYWNKLEANIDRVKQLEIVTKIKYIHFANVKMKNERLAALLAIFRNESATKSSTYLDFDNANLCADGIISLSKLVDVSSELQCFCLRHNRIDNMESAHCLSRSIKSHTCINQLVLTHCDLGRSPEILLVILQSDVKYIDLENNNIDSLGAVRIAEYLESDPPVEYLSLYHNRLSDDDAILISQALKRNTNLKTIHLYTNNITSIGVKALLSCVFDSSSLNAISESNHTMKQLVMFSAQDDRLHGGINSLLLLDRWQKNACFARQRILTEILCKYTRGTHARVVAFHLRQVDEPF